MHVSESRVHRLDEAAAAAGSAALVWSGTETRTRGERWARPERGAHGRLLRRKLPEQRVLSPLTPPPSQGHLEKSEVTTGLKCGCVMAWVS